MSAPVKLHAKPGLHTLHIGDDVHTVAADGTVVVPAEHVDAALSHGCAHEPFAAPARTHDRLADLEARISGLEVKWTAELAARESKRKG